MCNVNITYKSFTCAACKVKIINSEKEVCRNMKFQLDYKMVGERIKNCRLNKNMTQDTLAEMIEVNPSFISNIERGKTKMSTETLVNIAKNLHTSTDYLIFGDIDLEHDQSINRAVLEVKELLKDKSQNDINAFITFCKDFTTFLKNIEKW